MRELVNGETDEAETIAMDKGPIPQDPQMQVALAINDVIDLARVMSKTSLNRGSVEMRRRLKVMDHAITIAEKAAAPAEGNA